GAPRAPVSARGVPAGWAVGAAGGFGALGAPIDTTPAGARGLGAGNDRVFGDNVDLTGTASAGPVGGADFLDGGEGIDTLKAGPAGDFLSGGPDGPDGPDACDGEGGTDFATGCETLARLP
ncbi:hypothetical protein ACFV4S_35880, partial [Streptomyces sp. NPDC059742]